MIYFRGNIDRLYERIDRPGHFIHRDYKSSRWPRTQAEVNEDLQMWAYNWAIHEFWPECDDLVQVYDQLQFGELHTRKTVSQREQMKGWLQRHVVAIVTDDSVQADDLLAPKFNEWCPWCPILASCPVPQQLTDFARSRIAALSELDDAEKLDASAIEEYVGALDDV